jgi:hypothetical protein
MTPGLSYSKLDLELNTKVKEKFPRFSTVLYTPSNGRQSRRNDFGTTTGFVEHCISGQIAAPKEN